MKTRFYPPLAILLTTLSPNLEAGTVNPVGLPPAAVLMLAALGFLFAVSRRRL